MQVITSILISLVYLILSIGINLNLHFCEDEIKDVHLEIQSDGSLPDFCHQEDLPGCCGDSKEENEDDCSDCCYFVQEFYKIYEDHNTDVKKSFFTDVYLHEFNKIHNDPVLEEKENLTFLTKTTFNKLPVFLLNCSFIYYG